MKGIKRRKRQFLVGLLAFVLAMLPATEVWAQIGFTLNRNSQGEIEVDYSLKVNNVTLTDHDYRSGSGGVMTFYVAPGDTISSSESYWYSDDDMADDHKIDPNDANITEYKDKSGNTDLTPSNTTPPTGWVLAGGIYTITAPDNSNFTYDEGNAPLTTEGGWKV